MAQKITWEHYDGRVFGSTQDGDEVIEISGLQDAAKCAKWSEKYTPGRDWSVEREDGTTTGHSKDLRAAKRDALAALNA